MMRRLILAALLLAVAGCTTYGAHYGSRDYGYYDGYGYDEGYYGEPAYDGYGAYPYDYYDRVDYYGGYSPWGLGRYACGYHCSPWGSGWGWSLSFGNLWYAAPWYGSAWWPYHGYGWHAPYWPRRPHDHDHDRGVPHKPLYEDDTPVASAQRRSAPGEYVRPAPAWRGAPRDGVTPRPITGPSTPMEKPRPGYRAPPSRDAGEPRAAPRPRYVEPAPDRGERVLRPRLEREPGYARPQPREDAPRYAPRPQPRYAEREQPRYEQPRPQPRYEERPQPRYEQPRPAPRAEPRYEAPRAPAPRVERAPVRESRSASQNGDRED